MTFYTTKKTAGYRNSAEILAIVEAFEHCTLPPSGWNCEVYLTVAFWYLYLNSLTEAEQLISERMMRYKFENGVNAGRFSLPEKANMRLLLAAINDFIKPCKGEESFVSLANLVLMRFNGEALRLRPPAYSRVAFSNSINNPVKIEESI